MEPILLSENLCQGKPNLENLNLFVISVVQIFVVMISSFIMLHFRILFYAEERRSETEA